jgi:DNA-binding CsgD family transcriptional regulator
VYVNIIRRKARPQSSTHSEIHLPADTFFFHERHTGIVHFRVEAGPDGRLPTDQAAGMLAMHCLVRGQSPSDYVVTVEAQDSILGGIAEKAEKLLQAGLSVPLPVQLSRREEEVLNGIMRGLANKEIAATLNISERTIKFHVSSLLSKFCVRGRMELVREVSRGCVPARTHASPEPILFSALNRKTLVSRPDIQAPAPVRPCRPLPKRQMTA